MSHSCFEVELEENVAHLRMCRPEALNSLSREFWSELPEIVRELDDAGRARVLVLSSTGRHFTAGLDFELLSSELGTDDGVAGRSRAGLREMILQLQESLSCLERVRMPVIAAVQGGCVGGGVDMITACDMRYCTEGAFFCIQEINIGITADVGTLQRLPKIIPAGVARELAYTGRRLPARRAKEIGLVNEVYPTQEAMLESVMETAREIAGHSPLAVWGSKEMLNYARDHSVEEALNYIATWQAGMFQPQDVKEAFGARQEKRKPAFQDLPPVRKLF
jgi:enoyl-CoA hydratase